MADLTVNFESLSDACNLHSWGPGGSEWTDCCYTGDHALAECMWDKPREITPYPGDGFEISAAGTSLTAAGALELWKTSVFHHDVIVNEGGWEEPWAAIGAANNGQYAVVWFGREPDPEAP